MVGMTLRTRESGQAALLGTSTHPDTTSLTQSQPCFCTLSLTETPAHGALRGQACYSLPNGSLRQNGFICCHELRLHHLLCPRLALVHTLQQHLSSRPLVFPADLLADEKHAGSQRSQPYMCHKLLLGTPVVLLMFKMGDKCIQAKR